LGKNFSGIPSNAGESEGSTTEVHGKSRKQKVYYFLDGKAFNLKSLNL
jgi:hypothetical protein